MQLAYVAEQAPIQEDRRAPARMEQVLRATLVGARRSADRSDSGVEHRLQGVESDATYLCICTRSGDRRQAHRLVRLFRFVPDRRQIGAGDLIDSNLLTP